MQLKKKFAAIGTAATLAAGNVLAAVPTEVSTALSDAKSDSVSVAGLVLVAIVAIFAFALMRKALR